MSRHRNVRNLTEEDYYDYDDDYYDYDDDYYEEDETYAYSYAQKQQQKQQQQQQYHTGQQYAASKVGSGTLAATNQSSAVSTKATATATASTLAPAAGVRKPPPGWGKPSTATATAAGAGITKPPPGWGKPSTSTATAVVSGITSPPPGWGNPTTKSTSASTSTTASVTTASDTIARQTAATVTALPTNKSNQTSKKSHNSDTNTPTSILTKNDTYKPKPIPDILKQNTRSQLSMVVLGHVDAGKSTLMGQLLVQVGKISKREAQKTPNISWLLDEKDSERERGVTMEIGTKGFSVPSHDIVILDAPGHADFIPIMITGAANADVAILVVAAVTGEFEAGFDRGGQTKEHILLARGLGVSQVIVAVNKLDVEAWSQTRYQQIQSKVTEYLRQQQYAPKRIRFIPLSGLTGENVQNANDPQLLAWYNGPTLLKAIDDFQPANRQLDKPLRFIVTDVYAEGKGVITRGRVVQGFLEVGERLLVLPIGDTAAVNKLEHLQPPAEQNPRRLAIAMAGDTIELLLQGIDIMRVSVGSILCNATSRPPVAKRFQAKVLIMEQLTVPIIKGAQILFHMHSLDVPAVINKLLAITKRDGSVKKERPRALPAGCSAVVEVTVSDRLVLEPFTDCRALGRFVLRRGGDTIAVGVIEKLIA